MSVVTWATTTRVTHLSFVSLLRWWACYGCLIATPTDLLILSLEFSIHLRSNSARRSLRMIGNSGCPRILYLYNGWTTLRIENGMDWTGSRDAWILGMFFFLLFSQRISYAYGTGPLSAAFFLEGEVTHFVQQTPWVILEQYEESWGKDKDDEWCACRLSHNAQL